MKIVFVQGSYFSYPRVLIHTMIWGLGLPDDPQIRASAVTERQAAEQLKQWASEFITRWDACNMISTCN